jgi:hypothetical protein
MTIILNRIKAAILPQPAVLDQEAIARASLLRSIFMQGELGGMDESDWRVEAETQHLIEKAYQ